MIILTNCLTDKADEGCLKVANSLIKRIKIKAPETMIVSYGESPCPGDLHLRTNKLLLNRKLLFLLRKKKEPVLYIPAVAKAHTMAVRVFILSLFARRGMQVVQVMQYPMSTFSRLLLKASKARILTFSKSTYECYRDLLGDGVDYLKAGVDTERFCPVLAEEKRALRKKYNLPVDKTIVLHVGHLNVKRNVEQLLAVNENAHSVLVASTYAPENKDAQLKERLLQKANFTLIDEFLPNIEEVYQLADVYLFPVVASHKCIDVPLSALEAAACGIPVVTTPYGEMKELIGKPGFYQVESFEPEALSSLIDTAAAEGVSPRQCVLEYDWKNAVQQALIM